MAVVSDNLSAIRAAASARAGFDLTTWRLKDDLNIQSFACLSGGFQHHGRGELVQRMRPRYFAAGRALLLQLAEEPDADRKTDAP